MGTFKKSDGTTITKQEIDRRVKQTKEKYTNNFYIENGYYFCERTKRSDLGFERSHIISVKECQNNGMSEIAYCIHNIELLCRDAHMQIETWSNYKRLQWYYERKKGIKFEDFIIDFEPL